MCDVVFLSEDTVENLLDWQEIFAVLKQALIGVSLDKVKDEEKPDEYKDLSVVNPKRIFTYLASNKGMMLCMPGHVVNFNSGNTVESSLSCKILTIAKENAKKTPQLPSISGYLFLFDDDNGKLNAVLGAERITEWRTAAVTCIATELLWNPNRNDSNGKKILAIFGAGAQGRIHAIALQKRFHFDEIRIWNRTFSKAEKLVAELKQMNLGVQITSYKEGIDCARNADVVVTATNATATIVQSDWIKPGALVNVVGVGPISEVSQELYKQADVYVEDFNLTNDETANVKAVGELGQLLLSLIKKSENVDKIAIFQSRGMGIHDAVVGKLVYNKWKKNKE